MSTGEAVYYSAAMGLVILFCRALPFILFPRGAGEDEGAKKGTRRFLSFVERVVPPAAMTVLAFNAIAAPVKADFAQVLTVVPAALFTALAHLWKRNSLLSIVGGTALYMLLRAALQLFP